jgi:NAD(P)-dependent dehydrogenase (short-subunit alcohol dehydrogenase family)
MTELSGRIALVTGAGVNIGRTTARTLAAAGAAVVCFDINGADAEATALTIQSEGGRAAAVCGDVRQPSDVAAALDTAERAFGDVADIIVNNAAILITKGVRDTTLEEWRRVVDVTLTGSFVVAQAAAERMIARGKPGAIVNMCSGAGHRGQTRAFAYAAAKGGILNFTRSLAIELAPHRIRANSITPTRTAEPTRNGIPGEPPRTQNPDPGDIPLGRIGKAEDIAQAILFLVSDAAEFITGVDLPVDGGVLAMSLGRPSQPVRS